MRAFWGESQAICDQHSAGLLNKLSSQQALCLYSQIYSQHQPPPLPPQAPSTSRHLKDLAAFLCFNMHCIMIDRQMSPVVSLGLKAILCCCERRGRRRMLQWVGFESPQQSHSSIKNNPGVSGEWCWEGTDCTDCCRGRTTASV